MPGYEARCPLSFCHNRINIKFYPNVALHKVLLANSTTLQYRIFCTFTRLFSTNMLSKYTINCMRGVSLAGLNPRKQLPADEYWYYRKLCCLHRSLKFTHAFWQHCVNGFELRGVLGTALCTRTRVLYAR